MTKTWQRAMGLAMASLAMTMAGCTGSSDRAKKSGATRSSQPVASNSQTTTAAPEPIAIQTVDHLAPPQVGWEETGCHSGEVVVNVYDHHWAEPYPGEFYDVQFGPRRGQVFRKGDPFELTITMDDDTLDPEGPLSDLSKGLKIQATGDLLKGVRFTKILTPNGQFATFGNDGKLDTYQAGKPLPPISISKPFILVAEVFPKTGAATLQISSFNQQKYGLLHVVARVGIGMTANDESVSSTVSAGDWKSHQIDSQVGGPWAFGHVPCNDPITPLGINGRTLTDTSTMPTGNQLFTPDF